MSALTKEQIDMLPGLIETAPKGPWGTKPGNRWTDEWTMDTDGNNTYQWVGPKGKKPVCGAIVDKAFGADHILDAIVGLIALAPSLAATVIEQQRIITALSEDASKAAELELEVERLRGDLKFAEAALADIGDAEREPGDDLAWCERRAAKALPRIRAALDAKP